MNDFARVISCGLLLSVCACAESEPPGLKTTGEELTSYIGTQLWIFPEGGDTIGGFSDYHDFTTYYQFLNPNSEWVPVAAFFQGDTGYINASFSLPPNSQTSRSFSSITGTFGFHAAEFVSWTVGKEIQVSSTMYNNSFGGTAWEASTAVNGATDAKEDWYFGEGGAYGHNGPPVFDHWFVVFNPFSTPMTASLTLYPDEWDPPPPYPPPAPITFDIATSQNPIPGYSRRPFNPYSGPSDAGSRAAKIHCSPACVAVMTMYQRGQWQPSRRPNTQSALGSSPAQDWYLVGIPSGAPWQTRLYFFNASGQANPITLKFRNAAGGDVGTPIYYTIPALTRISYDFTGHHSGEPPTIGLPISGYGGDNLSLHVHADYPGIVVTKILYWADNFQWAEGASTTGHSRGGDKIVFPAGKIGDNFWHYVQIMNTGSQPTDIYVKNYWSDGTVNARRFVGHLNGYGMMQLDAGVYLSRTGDFSTEIDNNGSGQPIIAEAQSYYDWDDDEPNLLWYSGNAVEGIIYDGNTLVQP